MTTPQEHLGLRGVTAGSHTVLRPVLQGVQATGRLDGLLLDMTVRQRYRNDSADTLETVYTFPLPLDAVLLGFGVELAGRRLAGVVTERKEAEQRYEQAMEDGDTPVMLERSGDGLYTVNLGNFKPGETAEIEYRFGQSLAFEQDQVRLCIPTTVAPRYGDPVRSGGLQPHQVPQASLDARHGLSLAIEVDTAWAKADIGCATHPFGTESTAGGGKRLSLAPGAWLDRDVVFNLRPGGLASTARSVADGEGRQVVLASFQPAVPTAPRAQVDLKLLVDCSGSMAGDSMASAKVALAQVKQQLQAGDRFSFSRFGSRAWHGFRRLAPANASNLAMLQGMIDATDADLGGTEMEDALRSTIALRGTAESADILLITDGEVWNADGMIEAATASRHRVFAVGIGSAPAESLLRRLAEATGGACEFATPGESLQAAIGRMFLRIRQRPTGAVRVSWGSGDGQRTPDWVAGLPTAVFGGDTVHVFAGFTGAVPASVTLIAGDIGMLASAEVATTSGAEADTLPRMGAAARLAQASPEETLALALAYRLVTDRTHCLVVHQRDDADKATGMAQLHQVPSMLAAGWGGTGLAERSPMPMFDLMAAPLAAAPNRSRMPLPASPSTVHAPAKPTLGARLAKFRLGRQAPDKERATAPLDAQAILQVALGTLAPGSAPLGSVLDALDAAPEVVQCLDALVALGLDRDTAWAVLLRWLAERGGMEISPAAEQALDDRLAAVTADQWRGALAAIERHLATDGAQVQ